MGYNLFISHKACSLVLDHLSQRVFICINFVIYAAVNRCQTIILKASRQEDIIVINQLITIMPPLWLI